MGFKGRRREARPPLRPSTEEILADLRDPLPPGKLEWGMPTLCPRCHEWGYLDRLDLVERLMQLHCPSCRFHWEITEAQIEATAATNDSRATPDS